MPDKREKVSFEEIALSNMYSIEALVRILVDKELLTQEEVIREIKKIQMEHGKSTS